MWDIHHFFREKTDNITAPSFSPKKTMRQQALSKQMVWLVAAGCIAIGLVGGYLTAQSLQNTPEGDTATASTLARKTIVIAGDISCDKDDARTAFSCRSDDTAALIAAIKPDAVLTTGDNQYPNGTMASYQEAYDKTWGAFKDITYPTPGNHEYRTPGAAGYYDYFGDRAGERDKGYYSYKIGDWLMVALNSEIDISSTSQQISWLKQLLADNKNTCALAYWHQPRFSTGGHASNPAYDAAWRILYDNGVDVVVNGHSHGYERYAPQDPDGNYDTQKGITQIISGMGGNRPQPFSNALLPNLVTRQNHVFGVLKLTLHQKAARYQFLPIKSQQTYSDSGLITCH